MPVVSIRLGERPAPKHDAWVRLADDALPTADERIIVSLARLKSGDNGIFGAAAVGVELDGADAVEDLAPWLSRLSLVALRVATFKDGRLFTSARLLRQRYKFVGEVRAAGDFLPDQAVFLARAGVDTLEVTEDFALDAAANSLKAFSVRYQHSSDALPVAADQRLRDLTS